MKYLIRSTILITTLLLASCGGGGGASTGPVPKPPIPPEHKDVGAVLGEVTTTCINDGCSISKLGWAWAGGVTGGTATYTITKNLSGTITTLDSGTISIGAQTSGALSVAKLVKPSSLSKDATYSINFITLNGGKAVANNTFVLISSNNE